MKKLILSFCLSLFLSNTCFASYDIEIPNEFYVTQHWISYTTSFDIETKTRKLGTLYRRFWSLILTYDFYNNADEKLASARSKFFSLTAEFYVRDTDDHLIGVAKEKLFSFFPTFIIYDSDYSTKLASAKMNFWGTRFTIYDPETDKKIAQMHRSFFRVKNNWTIKITNPTLFHQKQIDSRLLMTVLAFQGDREYWENQNNNELKQSGEKNSLGAEILHAKELIEPTTKTILDQIKVLENEQGLQTLQQPSPEILEAVAEDVENNYDNTPNAKMEGSTEEKLQDFVQYCFRQIQSNDVPISKKQAILTLLKMRLS